MTVPVATRLSSKSPAFFMEKLEQALSGPGHITEVGDGPPNRQATSRSIDYVLFERGDPMFDFDLSILVRQGMPDEDDRSCVRSLFADIIALDERASRVGSGDCNDAELFSIVVKPGSRRASFSYTSITVNTEWEVHFCRDTEGNWVCLGMPDWRNPGTYID